MKNSKFKLKIPVSIFKEGDSFVAYTPALDVSTSAPTYEKVKERFEEIVVIFMEELEKNGTTTEYLESLGWQKENSQLIPPTIVSQGLETIHMQHAIHA